VKRPRRRRRAVCLRCKFSKLIHAHGLCQPCYYASWQQLNAAARRRYIREWTRAKRARLKAEATAAESVYSVPAPMTREVHDG